MADYIGAKGDLADFLLECNLVDSASLLNPDLEFNPTYLCGSNELIIY